MDFMAIGFQILGVFLLSVLGTWAMIHVNVIDVPKSRSSHTVPTPRAGGVAVVVALVAWGFFNGDYFESLDGTLNIPLFTAAFLLAATSSFWDDVRHLDFRYKFLVQIVAAVMAVQANCFIDSVDLPHVGHVDLDFFGKFLSFVWIVCFMNLVNFLDGLNGLCAGHVLSLCLFVALIGWLLGTPQSVVVAVFFVILGAATLGFFLFNYPRAKIFLGDIGSQSLGFLIGSLSLFMRDFGGISIFTVPILLFAPMYDIAYTTGFRFFAGENVWQPHKKFLFHRLNRLGYSHARVTAAYLAFSLIQGGGALLLLQVPKSAHLYVALPYLIFMVFFAIAVTRSLGRRGKGGLLRINRGKYHPAHRRGKTLILLALLVPLLSCALGVQPKLGLPLACDLGKNCWISNYMNHGTADSPLDYQCGTMTYGDHSGTDFSLENGAALVQGVFVLASDGGVVKAVRDGESDFALVQKGQKTIDKKECGNGVVVDHGDGWETQYCHMKQGSIQVQKGQRVEKGAPLGQVGQSGLSEYPHVHLTVRKNGVTVDPFSGAVTKGVCPQTHQSLWDREIPYVPGTIYQLGVSGEKPTYEAVVQGMPLAAVRADSPLMFGWLMLFGVVAGDVVGGELVDPTGALWSNFSQEIQKNQARRFYFFGKKRGTQPLAKGTWVLRTYYMSRKLNKRTTYEKLFTVQ